MFHLENRTALVTGAGQGMGAGIVAALSAHGAHVFVNDLFEERALETVERVTRQGGKATVAAGDITKPEVRESIRTIVEAETNGLDILVNNAGVPVDMPTSLNTHDALSDETYEYQLSLNFHAVRHFCKIFTPAMRAQKRGRILIITSESWRLGQEFGLTHYAAAKAACIGFMRNFAKEVGRDGVTINALSLGSMNNFDDFSDIGARITAVGRAGTPEDVGAAALYLVSDEASWMTGQTIALNGGSCTA